MAPPCEVQELISLLRSKSITFSLAESCTGGLIASKVTDCPGASQVFLGSAVTYSNESKERLLGVEHQVLIDHGAVSEETARQMAVGACRAFGSDYSAAVTGIAGPGGATDTKPVGLVFIAVSDGSRTIVSKNNFTGDRKQIRERTADAALGMLADMIRGIL